MSAQPRYSVTSILSFTKDGSLDTLSLPSHAITRNPTSPRLLSQIQGVRVEEPAVTVRFLNWDGRPSEQSIDVSNFKGASINRVDVSFLTDPTKALNSAITEVLIATVKPDKDLDQFSEITPKGIKLMESAEGYFGTSWGYAIQDPRKVYIVTGWASKEVHLAFAQTKAVQEVMGPWLDFVTDIENYHVAFKPAGESS